MSSRFPLIYTRVPGRPGDQRILTRDLVAPGYSNEEPTPFAVAKLVIARDWGINIAIEDIALCVNGPPFGTAHSTLITSEEEWFKALDRLNNTTEAVTFTLCTNPKDATLEE